MPRNSLSHSGCTSSKRSCQPVVLAVRQEADSPEGQRRPAGRGPERIRVKNLQQPLCLWGLVICIHTCCNMDALKLCGYDSIVYDCYSAIPFDQVFCAQPNSCKVTSSSTLPQRHQPLHSKETKCFNFHRPRLRELAVKKRSAPVNSRPRLSGRSKSSQASPWMRWALKHPVSAANDFKQWISWPHSSSQDTSPRRT